MDTTQQLIDGFIAQMDAKPKSIRTYRNALGQFVKWTLSSSNTEMSRATILAYKDYLKGQNYSSSTINAYLTPVKGLAKWMTEQGLIEPIGKVKGAKVSRFYKKDALTIDQAKRMISDDEPNKAATPREMIVKARDKALITTLLYTGTRAIELSRALVKDVRNIGNQTVLFVQGKGDDDKNNFVVLVPAVQKVINDYLLMRGNPKDDEPLFMSESNNDKGGNLKTNAISKIVKDRMKAIGLNTPRLTCHSTRHFFATTSILQGIDVLTVSRALRHTSIATTQIYIDQLDQMKGKAEQSISRALDNAPILGTSTPNGIITITEGM